MALSKFLDPKNDVAFRRIFGTERNKDILLHFINDILEFKGGDRIKEVTFLSTIEDPEIASKKQSIVDVLCKDENDVQIIVEMQVSPQQGFEKRAQYYAAKAYSRQLNRGKDEGCRYKDLKAVIFIAITDIVIFPEKQNYKSDHVILDKKTYENDLKDFSFTFIELPKFKTTDVSLLNTIIEKWCYFFKMADETSEADMVKISHVTPIIERAYEELNQFNWTEQELFTYEQEIKRVMDNRAAEEYKDMQIELFAEKLQKNEEQLQKNEEQLQKNEEQLQKTEEQLQKNEEQLKKTEEQLKKTEAEVIEALEKLAQAQKNSKIAIAKNLLNMNIDIISKTTGLTIEEVGALKKNSLLI